MLALLLPVLACGAQEDVSDALAQAYAGLEGIGKRPALDAGTDYRKAVGRAWRSYHKRIGAPAATWAKAELGAVGGTVFYPFSGPDLVTATTLFSDADHYVLVAIQSAHAPVNPAALDVEARRAFFDKFQVEWQRYGILGFFRTLDLDEDAQDNVARLGVTPILMAFAARMGYQVRAVEPLVFDVIQGEYVVPESRPKRAWRSVRLSLLMHERPVTVDYVRLDLSDGFLKAHPEAKEWLERQTGNPTLLKAASHLLQDSSFSILRDALVSKAPLVVQDETGLDYSDLARIGPVKLYGSFTRAHALFDSKRQKSLADAYRSAAGAVDPLPFAFSYQKDAGQRSLQVVRR
jgi:hypothetical protein